MKTPIGLRAATVIAIASAICATARPASAGCVAVSCSLAVSELWPPNHNLTNVGLSATGCSNNCTVSTYSDEDDVQAVGSGQFSPDETYNSSSSMLRLRSERDGTMDGRVYLVVVKRTDGSCDCCGTVVVPHDRSEASTVSVDSQAEAAQSFCEMSAGCMAPPGYVTVGDGPSIGPKQ